ncbi:MAG: hypothetical protein P0Y55_17790 [Candidatus Cohnella colombiensis]|uniref:Uncharacterized protein n=1 Tax=Candidatus Cohnella colombiensis TaxID=3121368 RepID=A0AA95EX39_9BACL|nr:MAG: hypothetical protein P0Y55_17790 [Cohnella sp.]
MRSTRFLLILSYLLLSLWWYTYWACTQYFIIFFPPVFIVYFGSLIIFLALSFTLFQRSKRWFSEQRIVACILLIPLLWVFVGYRLVQEAELRIFPPSESTIQSFVQRGAGIGLEYQHIDMSNLAVDYHRKGRILDIHVRFQSHHFSEWFYDFDSPFTDEPVGPDDFIEYVRRYFVFPEQLSSVTIVPKQITLYGYWDGTLIAINHFVLLDGKYKLDKFDIPLRIIVQDWKWYLEYTNNQIHGQIFLIENKVISSFDKSFW